MVLLLKAQYDKNFLHQDRAMALLRNTVPAKVSMQRNFVLNSNVILIALQSSLDDYLTSPIEFLYLSFLFRYSA